MLIQDKYQHQINFNDTGIEIVKPVSELRCFIKWEIIETIIFAINTYDSDCAQWIIYLISPPKWQLGANPWWLNKLTFFLKNKKNKKIRIRDDFNKDFYKFPKMIEKYLHKVNEVDFSEDNKKGELISRKITEKENKTIIEEYWKPRRTNELPWRMVYDRYGRTVEDIYKRDGAI